MGLVLWIDQNTFATALLEKVFKKKNLLFYTLNNARDIVYLIDDLRPTVLVLDRETALIYQKELDQQYASSEGLKNLPVIFIGEGEELTFISKTIGQLQRPFNPFLIPQKLEEMLNAN